MGDAEKVVVNYAINNGGVVGRSEALAMGMSARTLQRRMNDGLLVVAAPGVLALPGIAQDELSLLRAANAGIAAVASHQSAARLHGLDIPDKTTVTVSVPVRRSNRFLTVTVHQSTDLSREEVTIVRGIEVTDPPRTILDLAAVYKPRLLGEITDQAIQMKLASYETVASRLESLARRGKPGVVRLRKVLAERTDDKSGSESILEKKLIRLLLNAGLSMPDLQFRPPWLRSVNGRVDAAYIREQVIVEADSRRWHGSPEAFQIDRRRDNLAQLAGWTILRFTWEDVTKRPEYVAATVREALVRSSL